MVRLDVTKLFLILKKHGVFYLNKA